jgi:RNase P subunit RPR2
MTNTFSFQHFWDLAQSTKNISPPISRRAIEEMLEGMRSEHIPVPQHFVELFCFSCLTIFSPENCVVSIKTHKKHPNCKIISYSCITCGSVQHKNLMRSNKGDKAEQRKVNQRRAFLKNLFSENPKV